jgi:hypothetical protein
VVRGYGFGNATQGGEPSHPNAEQDICVSPDRILWLQPRAAGVVRELQVMNGPAKSIPIVPGVGLMVITPPYDARFFRR